MISSRKPFVFVHAVALNSGVDSIVSFMLLSVEGLAQQLLRIIEDRLSRICVHGWNKSLCVTDMKACVIQNDWL